MCDERVWQPQMEHFSSHADVVCADIARYATMHAIASALLAEVPWNEFSVAGLSMGGIVAMELLKQAPQRIKGCALLDTNHRAELPERQTLRTKEIKRVERGELRELIVRDMKPAYLSPRGSYPPEFLQLIVDMATDLGPTAFINQSHALRDRPDYSETLKRNRCPALLLCGEDDRLCPVSRHEEMQALLPNATLKVVEQCGHITTLEKPDQVNQALAQWLALPGPSQASQGV